MKTNYTESFPDLAHNIIYCDNEDCEDIIEDNGELLKNHYQVLFLILHRKDYY